MGPLQAIVSSVISIFFYAMMIAAVWKLFQMATDLSEIKTLLADIRRNSTQSEARSIAPATRIPEPPPILAGPISLESAEALLREVAAESHAAQTEPAPKTIS
jgi:hypothetical protein